MKGRVRVTALTYPGGGMSQNAQQFSLTVAVHAASVAKYCDHVEHNEVASTDWVTDAGKELLGLATEFAASRGIDLVDTYGERLGAIERTNVVRHKTSFDGRAEALRALTWRDLQVVQIKHDREYHGDVIGLAKVEQLRHYALHLTKIVGAFAEPRDDAELYTRRLPDTLLFAIKLHTVMGERLPDEALPSRDGVSTRNAIEVVRSKS